MGNKINFFTFCLFLISAYSVSQNTFIPDDNFEQALINLGYDTAPLDDFVPTANINTITNLDVAAQGINDLTGIQDFTALSILNCSDNNLTNLVISSNTNLTELYCNNNTLTSLNVSALAALKILWCNNNQINNLDVTNNVNLISIDCSYNQLNNLDVTQNSILNVLVCENNQISALNTSNNSGLNRFICGNNLLTNLDVSLNNNLSLLWCENNFLTSLNVDINAFLADLNCAFNLISELDLSKNSSLNKLDCSNNNLCKLNLKNGNNINLTQINFSNNINLNCVVVDNPSGNHSTWVPASFSNYVANQTACSSFVNVDTLNNVITNSFFILPSLTYGNYFTQSGGLGTPLNVGDVISTSQTIFIYNESACANNESSFNVTITNKDYFIPKYFTPNNDGNHDTWRVMDFTNSINSIFIFNAYGKLLKSLHPSQSWNGYYRGKPMQTNDYWYLITLNSGKTLKGHFTLKR